jgi:2-hydroxychromene-2-carboxylate isomerase
MADAGSWGVPTIRIGDWITWGQDRDWLVARRLEELCDPEDGILV